MSGDVLTRSAQDATALADVMRLLASMVRMNATKPGAEAAVGDGPQTIGRHDIGDTLGIPPEQMARKYEAGWPLMDIFNALRQAGKEHPIEEVGGRLRSMMPWISAGKQKVADAYAAEYPDYQLVQTLAAIQQQPRWQEGAMAREEPADRLLQILARFATRKQRQAVAAELAQRDADHIREAIAAGADEYVMKPFTDEVIADKLRLLGVLH